MEADEDDFVDDFAILDEKANSDNNKNENEENEIKDKGKEEKINKRLTKIKITDLPTKMMMKKMKILLKMKMI